MKRFRTLRAPGGRGWLTAAVVLLAWPATLAAAEVGAITGRVLTGDGEPVGDAVIVVAATGAPTRTAGDGTFTLDEVPAGIRLLEASSRRHGRGVERVEVVTGRTTEVEIVLERRIHAEQIVVTAPANRRGELDLAMPVTVLDAERLALALEPSLGETLSGTAGVTATSFAPGASRPVIRGLGGDRLKIMENGLGTGDASSTSPDHGVASDPLAAQRIEVIRGPATLLYGSNAIGGVVNVIDNRIPRQRPDAPASGALDMRLGSAADERSAALALDGGDGRWAWHVDFLTRRTGDVEIPGRASIGEDDSSDGIIPNSDTASSGGSFGVSFIGDGGFVGASLRLLGGEYGLPGGHHEEEEEEKDEGGDEEDGLRIDMRQRRFDLEAAVTRPFGPFQGATLRFGMTDYEHAELEGPGVIGTNFFNDAWEARAEVVQTPRGSRSGSLGVQLSGRDFKALGEEAFVPPVRTDNAGVFAFQQLGGGAVRFQFGARYEVQSTDVSAPDLPSRDFDGLSGSVGLVWQPAGGYSIGASVARSVKMPNGEELYSSGLHFATSAFELGNPRLDEEAALGVDVSLRKTDGRLTGALNLFGNDFSDFIFQRVTGEEVDGFPVMRYEQADAEFRGAELEASIALARRPHASWDLDLLWDVVQAELADGSNVPRIPPMRYGIGAHYRGDRLRAGVGVRRVEAQDRPAARESRTAGYTTLDADLTYRIFLDDAFLDLMLRGSNLTDVEARNHVSFVKDDVPLPGRNVSLIARLAF